MIIPVVNNIKRTGKELKYFLTTFLSDKIKYCFSVFVLWHEIGTSVFVIEAYCKLYKDLDKMKAYYKITTEETGIVELRNRRIAKAFRWWLRENGLKYEHSFYLL